MMIGGALQQFAERKPTEPAIICDGAVVTWRELYEKVETLAQQLDERCAQGAIVALVLRNSPSLLAHLLACARSNRVAAVLDAGWPVARIDEVLSALRAAIVYSDVTGIVEGSVNVAPPAHESDNRHRTEPDPEAPFYIGFTSGSTGRPKGYCRSHKSWLRSFDGDRAEFGISHDDVILAPGSMTHSLFLYAAVHGLHIGATVLMQRNFHPARALRTAIERRATVAYAAPTQWRMMFDAANTTLPDLRWALSSGAKWLSRAQDDVRRIAPNASFAEFYGASELSFVAVRKAGENCPEHSVGRAFGGVKIAIRDNAGNPLGPGETGRIFVSSPYLFSGYAIGDEDVIRHADEISVGDMGYMDAAGFLHLLGRKDRMIVTSGKNVFAEEVEKALESIGGIRVAAVFGAPDDLRGQKIVACILPEEGCDLDRSEVVRRLRELIPSAFIPRDFVVPERWSWTRSGKTDFKAMRSAWDEGSWEELR